MAMLDLLSMIPWFRDKTAVMLESMAGAAARSYAVSWSRADIGSG
jgi:hypothetical protein